MARWGAEATFVGQWAWQTQWWTRDSISNKLEGENWHQRLSSIHIVAYTCAYAWHTHITYRHIHLSHTYTHIHLSYISHMYITHRDIHVAHMHTYNTEKHIYYTQAYHTYTYLSLTYISHTYTFIHTHTYIPLIHMHITRIHIYHAHIHIYSFTCIQITYTHHTSACIPQA